MGGAYFTCRKFSHANDPKAPFPYVRIRHPASGMRIRHADPASGYSVSICTDITDKVQAFSSCFSPHVMMYRGGQRFANFCCTSFKTNICVDTEGKCATCLDTFLRF